MAHFVTKSLVVSNAKLRGIFSPLAIAGGDQIGDHAADILLLRGVVVGAGMIARDGHRPGVVAGMKLRQEPCRIVNIARRLQHLRRRGKFGAVEMVVDLHAAEIDEHGSLPTCLIEDVERDGRALREDGLALDVECPRLQRSLLAGFRQTDGIENSLRNPVFGGRPVDFPLAKTRLIGRRRDGLRDKPARSECCQERQNRYRQSRGGRQPASSW